MNPAEDIVVHSHSYWL